MKRSMPSKSVVALSLALLLAMSCNRDPAILESEVADSLLLHNVIIIDGTGIQIRRQ